MARKKANGKAKASRDSADTHAFVESDIEHAPVSAKEDARLNPPLRVVFTHYRARLCDLDNLSTKAVLDAIVRAGISPNDTAECVTEIIHRQVKDRNERTVVSIEEI